MPNISWTNYHRWFSNYEIRESFLPRKFPYMVPALALSTGRSQFFCVTHRRTFYVLVFSQIKYLYDQKGLLDQLEGSNVTTDLGGTLCYDHKNWVHNRLVC